MKKRSIFFLTNAYPDFDTSTRGIFIKKMAHLLQKEGYQISVVTPRIYQGSPYFEKQESIRVYRFPFLAGNKLLIEHKTIPYLKMLLYFISGFIFTVFVMLKNRCELIHVHWAIPTGVVGLLAGLFLNKPLVVTVHGSDFRMAMGGAFFLRKLFYCVCKRARQITCVSEFQKQAIEQLGVPGEKISILPMGVDQIFLENGKNRKDNSRNHPYTIFTNRNLLPFYNVSLILRAIPMVLQEEPETKFWIAGDGPERQNLRQQARKLNLGASVRFLGRIPHEKMPNLLAQADIFASTSLYDGTSVSLLEAMGSGVFPIATDIPANREWITDGENGFLIPTDDEGLLAKKIIDAIRNRAVLENGRRKNVSIIEERALWSMNIKKVKQIYGNA